MGWEIKNQQFFCNTSDTFFGPYLDESIWPNHDEFTPGVSDKLFHNMFNSYLRNNPQKNNGSDPRGMTPKYLEKLCNRFEEQWLELQRAVQTLVDRASDNNLDAIFLLTQFHDQSALLALKYSIDFAGLGHTRSPPKKTTITKTKKKATKKKATKGGVRVKKKATPPKKKARISSWSRYELVDTNKGTSKFWEVKKLGAKYSVRYGKIGAAHPNSMDKVMESSAQAYQKVEEMINSKTRKGYRKVVSKGS